MRLEESGIITLPEKARKTLVAANQKEAQLKRKEKLKSQVLQNRERVRMSDLEKSNPVLHRQLKERGITGMDIPLEKLSAAELKLLNEGGLI